MADTTAQALPFSQAWTNTGQIATSDDWSGVLGVVGYRGDGLVAATAVDPQTVLADGSATPVDVNANQANPDTFVTGGVSEFAITDPVVALQGSGTARAPHLVIALNTTGASGVSVAYNLRDVDGSIDNAVQPVAVQYRVGGTGNYTNVAGGFVADATTGPSLATLVTPVSASLPAAAANQAFVEVRIITTDAAGSDEWVGVDDISITATVADAAPAVLSTTPADGATNVALNSAVSVTFTESVTLDAGAIEFACDPTGPAASFDSGPATTFAAVLGGPLPPGATCTITVDGDKVHDADADDPPDIAADRATSFTTASPADPVASLPFAQNWSDTGLVTTNDNWSGVTGVAGYLGQNITTGTGVDPQTLVTDSTVANDVDVIANQTNPNTLTAGGVAEFHITNPVVALQGSATADAPYVLMSVDTTGHDNVTVAYNVRDVDGSADNAVQQVALQYRLGSAGDFTNLPGGYVADATTAGAATQVTPVSVELPAVTDDQPLVQVRVITTNAVGSDEWVGIDDISIAPAADAAPAVQSTRPPDGGVGIAVATSIDVTFNEAVDVADPWFTIQCADSGAHAATVLGGPTSFTLTPTTPFDHTELCTVTIVAAQVTDEDSDDPPDAMASDVVFSFATAGACGDPGRFVHEVQGSGATSPLVGTAVEIEGIVVGDYQGTGGLEGFYVQEEAADADADPATSEGVFVFEDFGLDVATGDVVRVAGTVTEFFNLTEVNNVTSVEKCGNAPMPAAVQVDLPREQLDEFEPYEGMVVEFAETLTVTETFVLGRFGEVLLSSDGRLMTPTAIAEPGAPAIAQLTANDLNQVVLDDGSNVENPDPVRYPEGGLSAGNPVRSGYTVTGLDGVLDFRFGSYRVQPTAEVDFVETNPRPATPADLGGERIRVGAYNVLNYFNGNGLGGGFPTARGAETPLEFERQRTKIIEAIVGLDADILGLMELENDAKPNSAIEDLVAGLNAKTGAGTYAFIDTGIVGTDAIRVGILYQPGRVSAVGDFAVLDSTVDPAFIDTRNRPVIAQTFEENDTGARLTVAVNHLKSKGSACDGDPDTGDGQGNCNATRTAAAAALVAWLANDPTNSGDPDRMIIGDLNAYALEDPIDEIKGAGYRDLIQERLAPGAYSFVFDGMSGYLDHALASESVVPQVTGITEWHINADEPIALDYNTNFKSAGQIATFYGPTPYRSSDHDPVLVGLDLDECQFEADAASSTMTLLADCFTDETIEVADGWTLDGDGYTITAVDPRDGHFVGAIVANAGDNADVTDVTITTRDLADVCHAGDDRLRGILLDGASGSVTNVRVLDLNQGLSGCQEGNGIEARHAPFDTTGTDTIVTISGNEVVGYQKTGILVNGSVFANVLGNEVTGWGPTNVIAQNGVQIGFGGAALIRGNTVSGNSYTGPDLGCGLLFFEADGVKQQDNVLFGNEQDVCNFGRGGGKVKPG
jgi:predicted extracellular nuclease